MPWIDEESTLAIWVATRFLLLGVFRSEEGSIFTYGFGGKIIGSDFLPFSERRTLAFCRCHNEIFGRNSWVSVLEEQDMVKKKGNKKAFCVNDGKGMSLSADDNKYDVKVYNESIVKRSIILMKQKLFQNNY